MKVLPLLILAAGLLSACATTPDPGADSPETPVPQVADAPYPVPITAGNQAQEMFGDLHRALASHNDVALDFRSDDTLQLRFAGDSTFAFGRADLRPGQAAALGPLVGILKGYPQSHLEIVGYTDNVGDPEFNRALSARRAAAVAQSLIEQGLPQAAITTRGAGAEHPVASNATAAGRSRNRRVEIFISSRPLAAVADSAH